MRPKPRIPWWLLLTALATPGALSHAQPAPPHLGYVYPAGASQSSRLQVQVGGQFLAGITNAFVTGSGVSLRITDYSRPPSAKELNALREQLQQLQAKRTAAQRRPRPQSPSPSASTNAWTAAEDRILADLRRRLADVPKRQANPALAETATLEITVASNAEPGDRELRLLAYGGLSNPIRFHIGNLTELNERPEPTPRPNRERPNADRRRDPSNPTNIVETPARLPAVLNGQIQPGDVDRFRFSGRQGQRFVAITHARALIPYLADAVPGWFQAVLSLQDATGQELTFADDRQFDPDPVLQCVLPRDGEYVLEIRDALYRGRDDFVYRIVAGELPLLTSHYPLGGRVGQPAHLDLLGWNLTQTNWTLTPESPGLSQLAVPGLPSPSRSMPFAVDTLPECTELEPNNARTSAYACSTPILINGRIQTADDVDVFRFDGRAGEDWVAVVHARRLNSPLDAALQLLDARGHELASNDDHDDPGSGLHTHHADPELRVRLPADGRYYVALRDAQNHGGPDYAYRLRLSPPRPDFELRVAPSSLSLRPGATGPLTLYALRHDGFTGPIDLDLASAPPGFRLAGARIPADQDQVRCTLTAPTTALPTPTALQLEGRARIGPDDVTRPAVPADDQMQAFAYRHLVPAQELQVAMLNGRSGLPIVRPLTPLPLRLIPGVTNQLGLRPPRRTAIDRFQLELDDPPDGVRLTEVATHDGAVTLHLTVDAAQVKPGLAGNLIVQIYPRNPTNRPGARPGANTRRTPIDTLPAIPFEIAAR